jgi:hypothetical protein
MLLMLIAAVWPRTGIPKSALSHLFERLHRMSAFGRVYGNLAAVQFQQLVYECQAVPRALVSPGLRAAPDRLQRYCNASLERGF